MDPVTHTLLGATLAETGLKHKTRLATVTLIVGANLPDVDILTYAWSSVDALWLRRGVTHGIGALLLLPVLLVGVMVAWDRLASGRASVQRTAPAPLLALSALAVLSHPVLDSLNVYGMRWLMPFSDEWWYGDTLFIVDPWIWAVLVAGIFLARRRSRRGGPESAPVGYAGRPARAALLVMAGYVALMATSAMIGRTLVRRAMVQEAASTPERIMVAPVPVTPFARRVVMDMGGVYRFGDLRWLPTPQFELDDVVIDPFPNHYAATVATRGPVVRKFLGWARFPYHRVEDRGETFLVRIGDARYTMDPEGSWAGIAVEVDK